MIIAKKAFARPRVVSLLCALSAHPTLDAEEPLSRIRLVSPHATLTTTGNAPRIAVSQGTMRIVYIIFRMLKALNQTEYMQSIPYCLLPYMQSVSPTTR